MSYTVKHLLQNLPPPVTASPDELVKDALSRMLDKDFSQLPVYDPASKQFYLVTADSILLAFINFGVDVKITNLRVSHALIKVNRVYFEDDDLFDLLHGVRDKGAALIVNENQELTYVVTSYDTTEYFLQWAEDIMHARDIETTLKRYITASFRKADGSIDELERSRLIEELTSSNKKLLRKFDLAVKRYLNHLSSAPLQIDNAALDAAFFTLIQEHFSTQTPSLNSSASLQPNGASSQSTSEASLQPATISTTEKALSQELAVTSSLHEKFSRALHCYHQQTASEKYKINQQWIEDAFNELIDHRWKAPDFNKDLTLDIYIKMLLYAPRWGNYEEIFQLTRAEVDTMLSGVRDTRNKLAHFREEDITVSQRAQLKHCSALLDIHRKQLEELFEKLNEEALSSNGAFAGG